MDTHDTLSSICSTVLGIDCTDAVYDRLGFPMAVEDRKQHVGRSLPKVPGQKDKQIWLKPKIFCWVWMEQCISQAIILPSHTVPGHLRFPTSVLLSPWQLRLKSWKAIAAAVGFCVWLILLPCKPDAAAAAAQWLEHYNPMHVTVMPLELLIWQNLDPKPMDFCHFPLVCYRINHLGNNSCSCQKFATSNAMGFTKCPLQELVSPLSVWLHPYS